MSICPYNDDEWETLPHVILTADGDWDPSILDGECNDNEDWIDTIPDVLPSETNPLFDNEGNYLHANTVANSIMNNSVIMDNDIITELKLIVQSIAASTHPHKLDLEKYMSKLGWAPINVIKATFENTTQFYTTPMSSTLKKRCKSPFPACNVHQRAEPVGTDTVYADTMVIDSGHDVAQFFVGLQ